MDQTNANKHDLDSTKKITQSSNSAGGDNVNQPLGAEHIDDCKENEGVGSDSVGTGGTQRKERNDNKKDEKNLEKEDKESPSRVEEDKKRPYEALEEIKNQKTHNLFCYNCNCNITKTALLFEIGNVPDPYNNKNPPFIVWIPLVIPFLHFNLGETWKELKTRVRNCLPWPSPTSPRFPLVAVLLLLSAIVLWSSPSSLLPPAPPSPWPLPGPISPLPRPGPPSPPPQPGPISPLSQPGLPSPWPLPGPISPLPRPGPPSPPPQPGPISPLSQPGLPSPWPLPGPISPLPRPGPPSPPPQPGPISPLSQPGLPSPWPLPGPISPLPRPGPPSPPPQSGPSSRPPQPGPHLHDKIRWVIHFISIKYLSVLSLLFLAILALPWHSISSIIEDLIEKIKRGVLWAYSVVPIQNLIPRELDILKSIVHGGLIESITSLGVVSSAAASGASTLNVLALGLANLFSGLFLIIYNLFGLKESQPEPYENLLGKIRRSNLHLFVVIVSFVFFGVIPPLFYGLSFKNTDKGHYKAAVVLAASLVCVISLSFAKAYAFGMGKVKTVVEYTGMAIGASALSFIASQIVADLFEKYGFHELASDCRKG